MTQEEEQKGDLSQKLGILSTPMNFTAESCQSQEVWEISETRQNSQACHVRLDKLLHEGREASVFSREEPADGFSAEATQTKREWSVYHSERAHTCALPSLPQVVCELYRLLSDVCF